MDREFVMKNVENSEDSYLLAANYKFVAQGFILSAKKLVEDINVDEYGIPEGKGYNFPFYFLISHAMELYLKAALLKRGFTEKKLKKFDYRHNLEALLEQLQRKGVVISDGTIVVVKGLSEQHKEHLLRYSAIIDEQVVFSKFHPPLYVVFRALDELLLATKVSTEPMPV